MCRIQVVIQPVKVPFRRRFNFQKAERNEFSNGIDRDLDRVQPTALEYDKFTEIIKTVSRRCISRGCRTNYIPGLDQTSADLLRKYESLYCNEPFSEKTGTTGEDLMQEIAANRREKWCKAETDTDMTPNSKKAWPNLRKLTGEPPPPTNPGQVSANQIATQLLLNEKPTSWMPKLTPLPAKQQKHTDLSKPFTHHEFEVAVKTLKNGKAAGIDDLTVE